MSSCGYKAEVEISLGLLKLTKMGFLESERESDGWNSNSDSTVYRLTAMGEEWLLQNEDLVKLNLSPF